MASRHTCHSEASSKLEGSKSIMSSHMTAMELEYFCGGLNSLKVVDVLVATRGIPSWTTFLREEDSKKSKEDQ
jgi:hypothetical protein